LNPTFSFREISAILWHLHFPSDTLSEDNWRMRFAYASALLALLVLSALQCSFAECLPFTNAGEHIGETKCIAGKIFRVQQGNAGVHYLDFCEDYRTCPFTVVIFARDLKHVGDVRQLAGKPVEIHGDVKSYDGRAEIILRDITQLGGEAARIPPLPKNYDVENRGHYSAGVFSTPSAPKAASKKRQTAKLPVQVPEDNGDN
jgi:hypothetical protein